LGFPRTPFLTVAENLPLYRQSPYIASAQKKCRSRRPRSRFFCISERSIRLGQDGAFSTYLFLHEIEKPPALFSAATFTKDELLAKKLLTFGFHLAMMQPTKRNDTE